MKTSTKANLARNIALRQIALFAFGIAIILTAIFFAGCSNGNNNSSDTSAPIAPLPIIGPTSISSAIYNGQVSQLNSALLSQLLQNNYNCKQPGVWVYQWPPANYSTYTQQAVLSIEPYNGTQALVTISTGSYYSGGPSFTYLASVQPYNNQQGLALVASGTGCDYSSQGTGGLVVHIPMGNFTSQQIGATIEYQGTPLGNANLFQSNSGYLPPTTLL